MKINFLKPYSITTTFSSKKDREQPLTKELREIFSNPEIPQETKATLWKLSETDSFCAASEGCSKADLLRLSRLLNSSLTNIPLMAINGEVKVISKGGESIKSLISLTKIAKEKNRQKGSKKLNLYEIIKSNPIFQYEKVALEEYKKDNAYPSFIIYNPKGLFEARKIQYSDNANAKILSLLLQKYNENDPITNEDKIILFNNRIRGKHDIPLYYTPTKKDIIEPPLPVVPWNLSLAYRSNIPVFLKKSLYDLSSAKYFPNLIKNTPLEDMVKLGAYNIECDNILTQMFNKKITFNLINPESLEEYSVPIIDAEKLLLDKKNGLFETNNLYEILDKNTVSIIILDLYLTMKKSAPEHRLKSLNITLSKGNFFMDYFITKGDEIRRIHIPMEKENYITQKLSSFLEKAPLKTARIDFTKVIEEE